MLDRIFHLKEKGTDVRTEILAGFATFMTMSYILAVNPSILSDTGMDFGKVFSATATSSCIACLLMGFYANLPFALSAGMGANAMFAYTVCIGMGHSWQWALSAILLEGLVFIALSFTHVREAIVTCIPESLKKAIGVGIGFFIASIGLKNAGLIIASEGTIIALNPEWHNGAGGLALLGVLITGLLLAKRVKGALLIGMVVTAILGVPMGITTYRGGSYLPTAPYFCKFAFSEIFASRKSLTDFIVIVFTFLYFDMFDTVGCLIACAGKSNIIQPDGSVPNANRALFSDAVGTVVGSVFGSSTVTTYIESSVGVAEGGRSGLTAVTVGVLFLISLFLGPLFGSIPSAATAPALILVGVMMIGPVKNIDLDDYTEAIPAFLTVIFMVCASSVSDGIMFGVMTYVLLKALSGRRKEIRGMTWIVFGIFTLKVVLDYFGLFVE